MKFRPNTKVALAIALLVGAVPIASIARVAPYGEPIPVEVPKRVAAAAVAIGASGGMPSDDGRVANDGANSYCPDLSPRYP